MTVEELPVWEAPHGFDLWQPHLQTRFGGARTRIFSYGLLLPQLAGLSEPDGARRVAERWGLRELVDLAHSRRAADAEPEQETGLDELAEKLAPGPPQTVEELAAVEQASRPSVSVDELEESFGRFASVDGRELVAWIGFRAFEPASGLHRRSVRPSTRGVRPILGAPSMGSFHAELNRAANQQDRIETAGFGSLAERLYNEIPVSRRVRWVYERDGRALRAPGYEGLAERAALEVDHLLAKRPRLSRCRLCQRIFVPARVSRPEIHCPQHLWLERPPHTHLERCLPPIGPERERIRRTLSQRYRRALAKHEGDSKHPDVRQAFAIYTKWLRENPAAPRGKRPSSTPQLLPRTEEENDDN